MLARAVACQITPEIRPELVKWYQFNTAKGCTPVQLRATLLETGYEAGDVERFLGDMSKALAEDSTDSPVSQEEGIAAAVNSYWNQAAELNRATSLQLGDRSARIHARHERNGIYWINDFLSGEECAGIIRESEERLAVSTVVDPDDGSPRADAHRTSRGGFFERDASTLVTRIENRIARLCALPVSHGEGLQVLHYRSGGEYRPHFDYFDPATEGGARQLKVKSQRVLTIIMYLSEVESGGETAFPELSLEFSPVKGAALMFPSIDRDGCLMRESLHAGRPVRSGEKWIATKWLRLRPY